MRRLMARARRDESGQMAGMEVLPFGLLTFLVGALLVANAWAVLSQPSAATKRDVSVRLVPNGGRPKPAS